MRIKIQWLGAALLLLSAAGLASGSVIPAERAFQPLSASKCKLIGTN